MTTDPDFLSNVPLPDQPKQLGNILKKTTLPAIPKPLTKRQRKLIEASAEIRLNPVTAKDASFISREFVQATLPHRDPKTNTWNRKNGNYTLSLQTGFDADGNPIGLPYGVIPRLLIFWMVTEAVRTKNPTLKLGNHLATFMREIGLDPQHGGKNSPAYHLKEQMRRFFNSRIAFFYTISDKGREGEAARFMQIADDYILWWDTKQPQQSELWESSITLDDKFFRAITANPVPVHTEALSELKNSPLALDLYALCCYEAYRVEKTGEARFISWRSLMEQMGANYTGDNAHKEFARKAKQALKKIQLVMKTLHISYAQEGGVTILPSSRPTIHSKNHLR
ncbi:MAG: plasmid encoded RepA protein [Nitrosomonas sp.]|nr:MAG: plasmid encoded RepA protein [Nitrosomonas sp.]